LRTTVSIASIALVCLTLTGLAPTASAATITLDATSRGWFTSGGLGIGGTAGSNYLAGEYETQEYRNYFTFDLSGVTDLIVSASLRITAGTYRSPDASETFALFDVSTPFASLTDGTGGVAAFTDLGSGTSYGSRAFTASDPYDIPVTFALNGAALTNLQAAVGALFGMGGAITTISGSADQLVFGGTGFNGGAPVQLALETAPAPPPPPPAVPEPATLTLLGTGLITLTARRRGQATSQRGECPVVQGS